MLSRTRRSLTAKLTRVTLDAFISANASDRRTLDIGAQTGPYARLFPNRVSLDLQARPGIHVVSDAQHLGIADDTFECVLCTEVLEHIPNPQQAIDEMWRVLRPGGTLLLTTRFLFPIHDAPHDYYRFTKYGLRHLLRRFRIEELREETTTVGTLGVLMQRLGMQTHGRTGALGRAVWQIIARVWYRWPSSAAEFGDSRRTVPEVGIMTSGYHVRATKPHG